MSGDKRFLVYTCVFGNYDRVFPPVRTEKGMDYVLVTENPRMSVRGWRTHLVDCSGFATPKAANLHFRALAHQQICDHDASCYVDGNVRVIDGVRNLLNALCDNGAALGVFPHSRRSNVASEIEACIAEGKVSDAKSLRLEGQEYVDDGFNDDLGLVETTILLKNHHASQLDAAMRLWNGLYQRHLSRDQVSLPYVLWKTGIPVMWHDWTFREPNPHFSVHPHNGPVQSFRSRIYSRLSARSIDSSTHRKLMGLWKAGATLQRMVR